MSSFKLALNSIRRSEVRQRLREFFFECIHELSNKDGRHTLKGLMPILRLHKWS